MSTVKFAGSDKEDLMEIVVGDYVAFDNREETFQTGIEQPLVRLKVVEVTDGKSKRSFGRIVLENGQAFDRLYSRRIPVGKEKLPDRPIGFTNFIFPLGRRLYSNETYDQKVEWQTEWFAAGIALPREWPLPKR